MSRGCGGGGELVVLMCVVQLPGQSKAMAATDVAVGVLGNGVDKHRRVAFGMGFGLGVGDKRRGINESNRNASSGSGSGGGRPRGWKGR